MNSSEQVLESLNNFFTYNVEGQLKVSNPIVDEDIIVDDFVVGSDEY